MLSPVKRSGFLLTAKTFWACMVQKKLSIPNMSMYAHQSTCIHACMIQICSACIYAALHYITLIYWRKLSPFFIQFDNHIILPFTRLKNKIKDRSRVSSQAGWFEDPISLPLEQHMRHSRAFNGSICSLRACSIWTFQENFAHFVIKA